MMPIAAGYVVEEAFPELGDFRLIRARREADGEAVLLKIPHAVALAPAAARRLEHEAGLAPSLGAGWALEPLGVERLGDQVGLVLADPGGRPLALAEERLGAARFIPLAIDMARAVMRMHEAHVVHKDLKPQHLWIDAADGGVRITGFGLATLAPKERPGPAADGRIAGTLAYMSPEQTGRMNRLIDDRTDLYSLGVIFYQMLTGRLPCEGNDPQDWMYCHVAVTPPSPADLVGEVPAALSGIVMKLLTKEPEARYQTAAGLLADLLAAQGRWRSGRPEAFPLGAHDVSERLQIPQRVIGRERELDALTAAFDRVVASGAPELVVVAGSGGVGKTALVNELQRPVLAARGLFLAGKFDRYQVGGPYATWCQAFREPIQQILTESAPRVEAWKHRLKAALGLNAQLIVEIVPQLAHVIGEPPPVPELPLTEAQNRFLQVFRQFVMAFAGPDRPLVIFLDDLQWADPASLRLLRHLVGHPDARHVLVVGAYRDKEIDPGHPLPAALAALRGQAAVHELAVGPLAVGHVVALVAAALRCGPDQADPLGRLVHQKTGGNPFFAIQFLRMLRQQRLLAFDPDGGTWWWDLERIRAAGTTENVVDLMLAKLAGFGADAREVLRLAAFVGHAVARSTLAAVAGLPEGAIDAALREPLREELLVREGEGYRFMHDRVRQAAYSLTPEAERPALHLRIGRLLLAEAPAGREDGDVFDLVGHFNRGAALLDDPAERERVAALDLRAGRRAEDAAAYDAAAGYYAAGEALLGATAWAEGYPLAFGLAIGKARATWLAGRPVEADAGVDGALAHAHRPFDRAQALRLRLLIRETRGDVPGALAAGLEALALFGLEVPARLGPAEAAAALDEMWAALGDRPIASLRDLPAADDREVDALQGLLGDMMTPASWVDADLFLLLGCRGVMLSLARGNAPASVLTYAGLALAFVGAGERLDAAHAFGKLAYDLAVRLGSRPMMARIGLIFGNFVNYWRHPVRTDRPYIEEAYAAALETGDLTYATYSLNHLGLLGLVAGDPLDVVAAAMERARAFAARSGVGWMADIVVAQQRLVRALQGGTGDVASWSDADFDDAAFADRITRDGVDIVVCWWHIFRLQGAVLAGAFEQAAEHAERARALLWTSRAQLIATEFELYDGLAAAATCPAAPEEAHQAAIARVAGAEARFRAWAAAAPANFAHKADLLAAEAARLRGDPLAAEAGFEAAARGAREQGFVQLEALAHERAAAFHAARGLETSARAHRREARAAYARWGAAGKVAQLDRAGADRAGQATPGFTATLEASAHELDLLTVLRVSHAISQEIRLPALVEVLMRAVLESTGATRGCLLLVRDGEPRVVAVADDVGVGLFLDAPRPPDDLAPLAVVNYVRRTGERVVLDAPAADSPFADAYLAARRPRSALGFPILRQSKIVAMLYLENDQVAGVFTPPRLQVLGLLATQAAISIENSLLYAAEADRARLLVSEQKAQAELAAARELDRLKNQFVGAISHDLRIPLTVIIGYGELLDEGVGGPISDQQRDYLGQIRGSAQRLERLVNDLLDFARMEAGTFALLVEEADFGAKVREMVEAFRPQADGAGIALIAEVPAEPLDLRIDAQRIEQVLGNLIGNALKFTPTGGAVRVRAVVAEGAVRCEVVDTGPGIAEADLPRLFQRFSQLEAGARQKRGTGLGLSISKAIVEAHGGRIGVTSEPGAGSVFWFELPRP